MSITIPVCDICSFDSREKAEEFARKLTEEGKVGVHIEEDVLWEDHTTPIWDVLWVIGEHSIDWRDNYR